VEHLLYEPVELTELELDAVSGGNPFSITISATGSTVYAYEKVTITNAPSTAIQNIVDNSINISGL
jgi:hypothetical protein